MTEVQTNDLKQVAEYLGTEEAYKNQDSEDDAFEILRPCEGCVPEGYGDEDLTGSIRRKFGAIYWPAIERFAKQTERTEYSLTLVIDASFEGETEVAIIDRDSRKCLLLESCKAWHFRFKTDEDIANAVQEAVNTMAQADDRVHVIDINGDRWTRVTGRGQKNGRPIAYLEGAYWCYNSDIVGQLPV